LLPNLNSTLHAQVYVVYCRLETACNTVTRVPHNWYYLIDASVIFVVHYLELWLDPHQRGSHLSVATSTLLPQLERASKSTLSQIVRLERALVAQRTNYILILSPPLNQNEYNPFWSHAISLFLLPSNHS